MRRRLPFLLLTLVPFAFLVGAEEKPPEIPVKKDGTAYKVVRIVDGDTIIISMDGKDTRVRLIGVDTPETVHPNKPVEAYGKEASRFTTNLLKGESVYLEYDQTKTDKYGRTLAYVFRAPDGLFINLEIVRQGYGHAYTKFPFKHMDLFRYYGRQAREAERGLWGASSSIEGKDTKTEEKDRKETTVYITNAGAKYHRADCRHLAKSKIPISLEEAKGKKYEPCKVCNPPE